MRLDYSSLDGPARQRDRKNREAWERERLANIEEGKADLARLAPNLKVEWVVAVGAGCVNGCCWWWLSMWVVRVGGWAGSCSGVQCSAGWLTVPPLPPRCTAA